MGPTEMTPRAVMAGEYDTAIGFASELSPNQVLEKASQSGYKHLTPELVCALLQRREMALIARQGHQFTDAMSTSLSSLTVPQDMWTPGADIGLAELKWLLIRGACIPYQCWQQWGIKGEPCVRELVDMILQLPVQRYCRPFENDHNGWFWAHLLYGVLLGDRSPDATGNTGNGSALNTNMSTATNNDNNGSLAVTAPQTSPQNMFQFDTPAHISGSNTQPAAHSGTSTLTSSSHIRPLPVPSHGHQQQDCTCRMCLALYVVDAGAAHEARWCEEVTRSTRIYPLARQSQRPPPRLTMLDVLKMEYNSGHQHNVLLARLRSRIPEEARGAVYQIAYINTLDPILLNYVYCGGVLYEHMGAGVFVDYYLKLHEILNLRRYMRSEVSTSAEATAAQDPSGSGGAAQLAAEANIDAPPLIRCSDMSSTLCVMKSLMNQWKHAIASSNGQLRRQADLYWQMAVNTACFWLDIEIEERESIEVTIDGHTTWMPVTRTANAHLLSNLCKTMEDVDALKVTLTALCHVCGVDEEALASKQ